MNFAPELSPQRSLAEHGSYEEITEAYNKMPFQMDVAFLWSAAKNGNIPALEFAHDHGASFDIQGIISLKYTAAYNGHFECLQFLHQHTKTELYPPSSISLAIMVTENHDKAYEMLRWAYEIGKYPLDEDICTCAASKGHLKALEYAHEHGAIWDDNTSSMAAMKGHVDCLQYVHQHGCKIPANILLKSASSMECIEYVIQYIDATWHPDFIYQLIVQNQDHDILYEKIRYLHERYDCPISYRNIYLNDLSPKVREYILENGRFENEYNGCMPVRSRFEGCKYCQICALKTRNYQMIEYNHPDIMLVPELARIKWARRVIYRSMERAYIDPAYTWCVRRLKRDYVELMNEMNEM